jgi:hypothetical protein
MQLIFSSRDALVRKLQVVSNIVEKRNTLPVLANVLIRKNGQQVELISTDVEMQISTEGDMGVGADVVATTVGARKLLDILKSLPDGTDAALKMDGKKIVAELARRRLPAGAGACRVACEFVSHPRSAQAFAVHGAFCDGTAGFAVLPQWCDAGD